MGSLSPSRAADFLSCPLMFRFRTVDRLPEPSSPDAVRGTLVHKVLEDIFDLPAAERTRERAHAMLRPAWAALTAEEPRAATILEGLDEDALAGLRAGGRRPVVRARGPDPARAGRARGVRGVPARLRADAARRDRPDRRGAGRCGQSCRLQDGTRAREGFEARALFQLRFYGLMIWRTRGVVPKVVRLVYLGDSQIVSYEPDEADLVATERKVQAIWAAIREARETGDYQPSPGRNCDWCAHHALCPAFGGTPPPIPPRRPRTPADPLAALAGPGSDEGGERRAD